MPQIAFTHVLPGEILAGKYRIERLLGEGAMGTVVAARHLLLEQYVAIKFLRPELAKETGVSERFRREAKAAARIKGEHVVRVFDVGETENGLPYLVMEYVEGMNLAEVIAAEGAMPTPVAVDYILQACDALAQAHEAGIVHRDVKPSNLFVSHRPDGRPLVKVLDFGISKVTGSEAAMTQPSVLMGSPLYMSPEQLLSSRDVDGRSDIWSLGIVLYELLTGTLPFVADTIPQICMQIQDAPAPSPRKVRADIPASLEAVVLRCLEKNPALRYGTIPELVSALGSAGGSGAAKNLQLGTGTRHYDDGVPASAVGGGSQRGSAGQGIEASRGPEHPARRTRKTVAIVSGVVLAVAAVAALTALFRGDRATTSDPPEAVVVQPPVVPELPPAMAAPPAPSPSTPTPSSPPAPPPSAENDSADSPVVSPPPSRPLPASSDATAAPRRSGTRAPSTPRATAKGKASRTSPPATAPRAPNAPQNVPRAIPALPGDRK